LRFTVVRYGFDDCIDRPGVRQRQAIDGDGGGRGARVTFSSKISNCLRTELRSCCECSSITRIFHLDGGLTERIASKNSRGQE
jgi:hypothetical protein